VRKQREGNTHTNAFSALERVIRDTSPFSQPPLRQSLGMNQGECRCRAKR
jgi:hypothetical protein